MPPPQFWSFISNLTYKYYINVSKFNFLLIQYWDKAIYYKQQDKVVSSNILEIRNRNKA